MRMRLFCITHNQCHTGVTIIRSLITAWAESLFIIYVNLYVNLFIYYYRSYVLNTSCSKMHLTMHFYTIKTFLCLSLGVSMVTVCCGRVISCAGLPY